MTDRERYEAARRAGIARAEALAVAAGVDVLPLDVVAGLLPAAPEWEDWSRRITRALRRDREKAGR